MQTLLLTGGTGYIGSHTAVVLQQAGYKVVLLDNLSMSSMDSLDKIENITKIRPDFVQGDICSAGDLDTVFGQYAIDGVIHFAGLKSVPQSFEEKDEYYRINIGGTENLLGTMEKYNVTKIVFSSSCSVYGEAQYLPIDEKHPIAPISPYAQSKASAERAIQDWQKKPNSDRHAGLLRYFNPVGAHQTHLLGEELQKRSSNLVSYITWHIQGEIPHIDICGNDCNTHDGTPMRDYIHVMDVAEAHLSAMQKIATMTCNAVNLGTGKGYTVMDVINAFDTLLPVPLVRKNAPPRQGDPEALYADVSLAKKQLGWQSRLTLNDMIDDHLEFLKKKNM